MNLVKIGTTRIPLGRCCDYCGEPYPDCAIRELGEIHVYHRECVLHLEPQPAEAAPPDGMIQIGLFDNLPE